MKRSLVALLLAVFAVSSFGAADAKTQKRKTTKSAETIDRQNPSSAEKEAPRSKREMKITRNIKATDTPDVVVTPGPIPAGPPVERQLTRASSRRFDVRSLPQTKPLQQERRENEPPNTTPVLVQGGPTPTPEATRPSGPTPSIPAPAPINVFEGLDRFNWGAGSPPDTNGDVGPNDYIQTVNTSIGIFNKSTGAQKAAFSFNTFMSQGNFGNLCDTNNFGDPVVLYDTFEDRWIITDFAFLVDGSGNPLAPAYQCFAASMTGDPVSGGWNFYSIQLTDALNDYPKFGIWTDGLYMSSNLFAFGNGPFQNVRVWAFNKAQMYAGSPTVKVVTFNVGGGDFTIIPSNARLQTGTPPAGRPNLFLSTQLFLNAVTVYKFHVDWNSISLSTFTGPDIPISATSWPSFAAGVPQPGTATLLDSLSNRAMVQNQYTNLAGVESLWASHTVRRAAGGNAAPRWYQVTVTGGNVTNPITQAATWDPDAANVTHRWMPSVALDRAGDLAMGYSTSSGTAGDFPSIKYAGRLFADAPNTFSLTEQTLFTGTASQTGSTRWGDYSSITLDPDGCTFWYTTEYANPADQTFNHRWLTKFGSFRYPSCVSVGPGGTVSGTVTATAGGAPIPGVTVQLGARSTTTDGSGLYSFPNIPAGTYPSITASKPGWVSSSASNIVVTDGVTTTQNFSLAAALVSGCLTDTTQADFLLGVPANVDLATSPGDVTLQNLAVDQQNTAGTTTGTGFGTPAWTGQTFIPAVNGQLEKAEIQLFCNGCGATPPNLTLSVRNTAAGLPTGADLASVTIPGSAFGSGATVAFTATFGAPATLTSGTQYALILRPVSAPAGSGYFWIRSSPSTYANGSRVLSADSGGTWSADTTRDYNFKAYMRGPYAPPSGTLISSTKDANPSAGLTPIWSTLNWTATTPANTTLQFQVAASNNPGGPFNFVGPDGTAGTFFTTTGAAMSQFYGFRYLQYKAFLATTNNAATPTVNDVSFCFADTDCSGTITVTPTPASVCASSTGNTASGPAGETSYAWSITNGTITSANNIQTITYTAGASGTVGLMLSVVEPSGCHKSASANVTINPLPPTPTISGTLTFCAGSNTTLTSDSASGNQWYLGGNPIVGATNQNYVATAGGSYTVQVTDGNGCVSAMSAAAVVVQNNPPPVPTIAGTTNGTGTQDQACPEQPLTLTATSAGATSFQWYQDNNTLNGETASTYQATGVGTYYVTATVNGCTSAQSAGYVVQNPTPHSPFISFRSQSSATTSLAICQGTSQIIDSDSATGIQWYKDGVAIPGAGSQSYTFLGSTPGTYTFTAQLNALGCHSQFGRNVTITVNPLPATPTATPGGPTTFCQGGSVTLTSSSATGNQWFLNGNPIGGATNSTYSATASGSYTVKVTDGNACTSAASNAVAVTVNPLPATPTITPGGPTTFCTGGSVTLTSSSATGNQWYLNGNPIGGATANTYLATAAGSYTVKVTDVNSCTSAASAATVVTVNPNPNATITAPASLVANSTGNIASVANAGAGAAYAWSITGGTITGGAGTNSITFTAGAGAGTTTLNATVTTSAGCSDTKSANIPRVLPPVTVTSISPNFGTVTGGTLVTINGTGFVAGATVTLGGTAATNVVVVSSIKITAKTPAHAAGAVNVTVTNTDTSTGTLTNGYNYQPQVFDPNNDGTLDPADIFYLINYLFMGGPAPHGPGGILSGDANGDGKVDPADIFYLVNYLFLGGQKPNLPTPESTVHASAVGSPSSQLAGSITLGKATLRAGHYVVPVIMTSRGSVAPQAMSLKVHFDGDAFGEVTVRRAGAAKDVPTVFENSQRSGNDVSYLVAYDPRGLALGASRSAVVAEIEIESAEAGLSLTIDPALTMLSNQAGTISATVSNRNLEVNGTTIGNGASPRPHAPGHEVN